MKQQDSFGTLCSRLGVKTNVRRRVLRQKEEMLKTEIWVFADVRTCGHILGGERKIGNEGLRKRRIRILI